MPEALRDPRYHVYVATMDGKDIYLTIHNPTRAVREWLDMVASQVGEEIVRDTPFTERKIQTNA